ncbi:ribbon-helix-helix protein, CopG family [Paraburkholderia sp. BL10I2N1]|nr:ribbon-helix-helix protein, CopG family [Paraburkholderia sp. BL10I2N1]TDN70427.1 ribbon-helix-helix CopG family protein [Paraburkholderia sp. BL10I2N1]
MSKLEPMTRRNFFIPEKLYEALQAKAAETGTPVAEHVRRALADYLKDPK